MHHPRAEAFMTDRLHSGSRAVPGPFDTPLRSDRDDVIVVAHRAPLKHDRSTDNTVTITRSASGLTTALEPLVQARRGTWIAHPAGDVDALVGSGHGGVPVWSSGGRYRLRYVSLPGDVHHGFYEGFANEGLWPLCHDTDVQPNFRQMDQRMYRAANARFAEAVVEEAGGGSPLVLVQDYHFALVPRMLARWLPSGTVTMFWHIPWPAPTTMATCGAAHALLDGMLGSSLI